MRQPHLAQKNETATIQVLLVIKERKTCNQVDGYYQSEVEAETFYILKISRSCAEFLGKMFQVCHTRNDQAI